MLMAVAVFLVLVMVVLMLVRGGGTSQSGLQVVRVPADDFVVGDLPMVCVRTGLPADGLVDFESRESKFQGWWVFLLLLGPLGPIAIAIIYVMSDTPRRVGGSLPITESALSAYNRRSRILARSWLVPFMGLVIGALLLPVSQRTWIDTTAMGIMAAGLIGGFVMVAAAGWSRGRNDVGVALDGTGRWVELRNVHPDFAAAAGRQARDDHRRRSRQHSL